MALRIDGHQPEVSPRGGRGRGSEDISLSGDISRAASLSHCRHVLLVSAAPAEAFRSVRPPPYITLTVTRPGAAVCRRRRRRLRAAP